MATRLSKSWLATKHDGSDLHEAFVRNCGKQATGAPKMRSVPLSIPYPSAFIGLIIMRSVPL
jgi:hypothetical protein